MDRILITGVSSGIGRALTRHATKKGIEVYGTIRNKKKSVDLIESFGNLFTPIFLDVTDGSRIKECAAELIRNPNLYFDCIINNAGIAIPGPLTEIGIIALKKQIDVNVLGVFRITNAFLPLLKRSTNRKKIINISSVSGILSTPMNGSYCISKHALESMNDVYRRELKLFNIDVISVLPGPIKTKIWQKNLGKLDRFKNGHYATFLKKADTFIIKTENQALDVHYAANYIYSIITKKKNKPRYILHRTPIIIKFMANWVPDRLLDRIMWKNLNKK